MNEDNRKRVYDVLKEQTGYLDSYEDFNKAFDASEDNRRRVYDVLKNHTGYLDSYEDFTKGMSAPATSVAQQVIDEYDQANQSSINTGAVLNNNPVSPQRQLNRSPEENKRTLFANYVQEQLGNIDKELNKPREALPMPAGSAFIPSTAVAAAQRYGNAQTREQQDRYTSLRAARNFLDDANKLVTEAGKKDKTNFVAGALRGLRDKGFDPDTWMMGISETAYYNLLRQAAEKEERGEQLSSEEQQLLDAAAVNMAANAYYAQDLGRGYKAGAVTAESIPFMLQFALNPVSGAGKGIAKTILEHGIKRFGLNTAKRTVGNVALRAASRLAGDAVAAAGVTATTGLGNVAEDASRRMTGDVQFAEDDKGNIQYAGRENNVGTGEAIARAFTSTFFENQSEMVGNYFAPVMRGVSGLVKRLPGVKQLSASKVGEIYRGIKNNPTYKEFTDRTQWHGAIGEYAEEVYNNLASVAMGDMTPEELVDLDNNIDTFLGVGLMSAVFGGIGAAGFARDRYTLNRDVKRFESTLSPDEMERWQEVKRVAQNGDVEGVREFVKYTMRDSSLTPQEKKDEIKYIYDVMRQSAMENVAAEQTEEAVQAETDDIVANSDPQTNTYTECSRLVMNEVGEMVEVPGHIVGYMGGQPLWKPDGAGPEVEAVALKEGEYNPESIKFMPTQEVIDETAQAIREDAAVQAQRESTYSPDIVPPSIGTTFTDGAAQYKIAQQNPDNPNGGWLATRTTVDEKGKPKEEVVEITDEQYYNAMQAQIDAEEQQMASQQATDGVSTGNGRRLDGTGTQQPLTPQQQEVETFRQAGVDEEVIRNTIADRVKKAKVALDKAERQAKAPIMDAKTVKEEMAARKKALDDARAAYEGWNVLLSPEPVLQVQQTKEDAGARSFPQGSSLASKGVKDSTIEGQNRTQENQTRENLWKLVSYLNSKYGYNFADEVSFVEWITSKKDNIQWLKDRLGHLYKESIQNINDFVSIQNLKNKSQAQSDSEIESTNQTSRPLSADEADALLADMESRAEVAPELELTIENWDAQFGADALVQTPIGEVKMGENQFAKMMRQGRNSKLGMVKPTLENPDAIIEDKGGNVDENAVERTSSYIFVKAFAKPDGGRYYYFTSVTVSKDGREVVISNQEKSQKRISKLLRQNPVAWINDKFSSHPITQIEGSVPLSETNKPTQTDNRPALLGVNSPELSEDKGTNHSAKKQASAVETIPTDEKGRPLYHRASVDATLANINLKGLTPDEVDAFVQVNKDAAAKLLKKEEDKAPKMVTDLDKYVSDKAAWQVRVDDAQAQVDYWNQVADAIQSQRTQVGDATAEEILSMGEPMDGHELAAQMLATGKLPLLQSDFKRETGYKGDEARSLFGLFASEANGGMTIERAGEQLMLADQEAGTNFFDQSDPNAGRNAILDVLSEVRTRGDLTNYIRRNREAMAERERQAEYDAYADWCEREMHMTPEEYGSYQEYVVANNPYEGVAVEELDRIFAEAEEEIQTYLNQQDNGQQGTSENGSSPDSGPSERNEPAGAAGSREAGVSVLPEAQPVLPGQVQGRTEGAASQPGTADDGVRAEEGIVSEGASGGEGIENQINDENNEINVVSSQSNQNDTENEQGEVAGISGESSSLDGENEAATILRTTGHSSTTQDGQGSQSKESLFGELAERASGSNQWIDDITSITSSPIGKGGENETYLSRDGRFAIKVNDFSYLPDNSTNFDSFMNRVDAHNELFPNDAITILGFTRNSEGRISVVLSQPYISNAREATQEEIDNFLEGMDFYTDMSGNWTDGTFDIADTKPNNVLVDADGNLHFIDVLPYDSRKPGKMLVIPPTRNAFVAPEREEGENLLDYAERVVKTKEIDDARKEVSANPTDAQKEAGNYRKGHITLDGYDITIENPKGSTRSGVDANGQSWSVTMNNDYGYIRGTEGVDGDHIDVFLSDDPTTGKVYVIDQVNDDGSFDEHKVMYGFKSALAAKRAYLANYSPGWKGLGTISEVSKDEFKKWVESSHRKTKPFAEYKSVKVEGAQSEGKQSAYRSLDDFKAERESIIQETVSDLKDEYAASNLPKTDEELRKEAEELVDYNEESDLYMEVWDRLESFVGTEGMDELEVDARKNGEDRLSLATMIDEIERNEKRGQEESEKIKEQSGPVTKIEDVGEKIGGAKKDRFKEFVEKEKQLQEKSDSFMEELRKLPVSKIFNFNLEALRKDGLSNEAATLIDVIRRIVPSKPRTDWKLKRWVSDVFGLYRFCLTLATAEQGTFGQVLERVTHIKKIGGMYRAAMALGGFDSGLDIGQATLEELGDTAGHYDKEGNWVSIKGQWYVTNAGRYGGIYPDYESAKEALSKFAGENSKPKEKGTEIKFSVYSYKNSGESFITPKGKPNIVVESGFKSSKEALDYLNEHMDELQAKYRNMKDSTSIGFAPNGERKGKDWRGGKDVSAEDFRNTFGFRGVEFGNWANQQERQRALNQAYDAFMDLSEATGISPRGLSLGGELGMAFGARGGGGAAAHYEPGKVVINLTKTQGAGTLAHEWWHAIDNYFSRRRGQALGYNTERKGYKLPIRGGKVERDSEEERKEITDAFSDLMKAINDSSYGQRSNAYASLKSSYWKEPTELGARAFAVWVERKLSEKGIVNNFLANNNTIGWESLELTQKYYPYPLESDFDSLDTAFDNLFGAIEEKVDEETGNTILYRNGAGFLSDDALSDANDPVAKLLGKSTRTARQRKEFAERERLNMAKRVQELAEKLHLDNVEIVTEPITITDRQGKTHHPKGFYNPRTGKITVVVPNNVNTFDVEQTLLHEAVAHYGLRQLFGEHFDIFLDNVYNNADVEVRRKIVELAKKNGWNPRLATEEYLASLAEDTNFEDINASWWNRIKELFLQMLHKIGFNDFNGVTLSDNELRYILWRSYENLAEPGRYRSILGEAADVVKQHELKVGNYAQVPAETDNAAEGANDLYRETPDGQTSDDGSRDAYNRSVAGNRFKAQEAYQDSMLALKRLQEVVEKYSGSKLKSYENAYMAENQMSSKSTRETEVYGDKFFKPMLQEVANLIKQGVAYPAIIDYMVAKHGLERNEVFAKRDAAQEADRRFEKLYKELEQLYKLGGITQAEYDKRKVKIDAEKEKYYRKRLAQHLEEDYSGLTALAEKYDEADKGFKANARDMVNDFETRFNTRSLWEKVNASTKETLRKSYESGMMSKDKYDKINKMFSNYIPLRGWDVDTAEDVFEYLNSETSPVNSVLKSAKGRRSMSDDPLATIGNMAESTILQGNRNLMKQNFLNMAINHPTDVLTVREAWYVKDPNTGEWILSFPNIEENDDADTISRKVEEHEERMNMLKEKGEATKVKEGLNIDYRISARKAKEHIVNVKRNGKDYLIFVNGSPRAAQAVNGLTNPNVENGWMAGVSRFNRWMAANFTTRNPAFVMSNLARDLIFSISAVTVKEGSEYAGQFSKNILPSMRAISRGLRGKQPQTEADRYFQEFLDNGGETGFTALHNVDEYKRIVRKELKKLRNETDYLAAMKWVAGKFSTMNRWAEDVARFNAYMTSRQQGKTITESINDAKEVTVNFNRKGAGFKTKGFFGKTSGVFRGLYLFFNAAVQSLANFIKLGKKNPKAFLTLLGGFTAAGFLVPMLNALLIGDGDDDYYGNLPDWVRHNNLCIYVGDGKFFTLPLPIELRAFYGLGEIAYQAMVGKDKYASENVAYAAINQITELLPINPLGNNGDLVTTFMPNFFSPFWEAGTNEDFTGKPIFKRTPFNESMPEWTKAYKGTSSFLVDASKKLNDWTGGDKYKNGWIDKIHIRGFYLNNPAQIEHLFESYFGGMAKTFNQAAKTFAGGVESVLQGEKSDDLQWYSTPVLNRFINDASDDRSAFSKVNERYYRLYDLYEEVGKELRGYGREAARGDLDYLDKLNRLYQSDDYKKYLIFKGNKRIIDRIRDMEKRLPEESTKEKEDLQKRVAEMKRSLLEQIDGIK